MESKTSFSKGFIGEEVFSFYLKERLVKRRGLKKGTSTWERDFPMDYFYLNYISIQFLSSAYFSFTKSEKKIRFLDVSLKRGYFIEKIRYVLVCE